jgi:hypothetical protein
MPDESYSGPDPVSEQTALLAQIATHPAVRRIIHEIEQAPAQDRLATAERVATVQALEADGLDVPDGLRVTTRYFEDPSTLLRGEVVVKPTAEMFAESAGGTLCVSVGEIVCVSYGWETAVKAEGAEG